MAVQCVEQAVTEAPEKEEDGDEADRVDGLAQGQLRGLGALIVLDLEASRSDEVFEAHNDSMRL